MMRIITSLIVSAIAALAFYYMAPAGLKYQIATVASNVVPLSIKEKVESVIYTPAERREKLISQLEKKLAFLKTDVADTKDPEREGVAAKVVAAIEEVEQIVNKIEAINDEQSAAGKITTTVVKKAAELIGSKDEKNPQECSCGQ